MKPFVSIGEQSDRLVELREIQTQDEQTGAKCAKPPGLHLKHNSIAQVKPKEVSMSMHRLSFSRS